MSSHTFNTKIAEQYGIESAILIENIAFWIKKNIANNKNLHDGFYWTYNSVSAFSLLFTYMNAQKISRTLKKLESLGILKSGNYNKIAYDRTKWYTIIDESILQIYEMENQDVINRNYTDVKPIPDINTDNKTYINTDESLSLEVTNFTQWFYNTMTKPTIYLNNPPCLTKWGKHIDLLHRKDGISFELMERVATFALNDKFWKGNILSTDKFRKQFSRLEAQTPNSSSTVNSLDAFRRMCEQENK